MTELENLAIVAAVAHFNVYLERATVTVRTDHRACLALTKGNSTLNPRLRRMAEKLQGHDIGIEWWPGKKMISADMLSRVWDDDADEVMESQPQVDSQLGQMRPRLGGGICGAGEQVRERSEVKREKEKSKVKNNKRKERDGKEQGEE